MKTAEQIANKWALDDGDLLHDAAIEAMKEYAKLHIEAAIETMSNKLWIAKERLKEAYPLTNIK